MKIGIFTNNYLPNPYGVTSSVESYRKEFERLGHEVYIFAPHWKGYRDANPRVFRYPSIDISFKFRFPLAIPFSIEMDRAIAQLDLDIIHSQHPNLLGAAARKWARKKGIPLVFTWHTLYDQYAHFVPLIPRKWSAWWAIRNARKYAAQADQVIVPTASAEKIIRRWGVSNPKLATIPTGVDRELEGPDRERIRNKYLFQPDETVLFLNARLTAEKNVEFLFDAVFPLLEENAKLKFMIVGDGNLEGALRQKMERFLPAGRVIFCGQVPKAEIKDYFAAGDVFVYASISETQGLIINEAMYVGLPVVAVRASGVEDSVVDGKTGLLVPQEAAAFQEAIRKLVGAPALRREFSMEARRTARSRFTAEISAAKMLEVYVQAIEASRKKILPA